MKTKFCKLSANLKTVMVILIMFPGIALNAQETVTDYDGNVYQTVTIGTQVWMKENLKTTHYRNGDAIPNVTDQSSWIGLTTGAYCNYNNSSSYVSVYGRLYNWYTIADSHNICPLGWHIPTDAEWAAIVSYLGGEAVAGNKLKEAGTAHWNSDNEGNNSSGFTALPVGLRNTSKFDGIGGDGPMWTGTEENSTSAWRRSLYSFYSGIDRVCVGKNMGFSIRCLKDASTDISDLKSNNEFEIYPNPSKGIFNMFFGKTIVQKLQVEIYNLQGINVFSKTFYNIETVTIDLTGSPKGMYLVKFTIAETKYYNNIRID